MKVNKTIAKSALSTTSSEERSFSAVITSKSWSSMINKSLGDPRRAASFTSTLINAVSSSKKLAECKAETVISSALAGEALNLSLPLKHYSIVPYGDTATFQLGYRGLEQLAQRSNLYDFLDAFDVRQGEFKGRDPRTRQPEFEWVKDEDEREKLPIIGYYACYILKNGFSDSIYWSYDKILEHANRYSPAFELDKYKQILSGEMDPKDVAFLRRGTPWYDDPNSEAHKKMCAKTVMRQLLDSGKAPLSVEMMAALKMDSYGEAGQEIVLDDIERIANTNSNESTDTVVEAEAVVVEEPNPKEAGKQMTLDGMK